MKTLCVTNYVIAKPFQSEDAYRNKYSVSVIIPARNESDAEQRFTKAMNVALAHVTRVAQWRAARPGSGSARVLVLNEDPVRLVCETELTLFLSGYVSFDFERDGRESHEGGVKAVVREYIYSLRTAPEGGGRIRGLALAPKGGRCR